MSNLDIDYLIDLIESLNNIEFMSLLNENIKLINLKDYNGQNLLYWSIYYKNNEISNYLIENGIKLNTTENVNNWPNFYFAMLNNNFTIMSKLLQYGFDINYTDENDENALFLAIINDNVLKMTIKYLVDRCINVNHINNVNENVLFYAIINEDLKTVKYLLKNGINTNVKNNYGISPIYLAINNCKSTSIFYELINHNSFNKEQTIDDKDNTILQYLIIKGKINYALMLINAGCNTLYNNTKLSNGIKNINPFLYSVKKGYFNIVDAILINNLDNLNLFNNLSENALMIAVKYHNYNIANLLLENNIDLTYLNKNKKNILYYYKKYSHYSLYQDILNFVLSKSLLDFNNCNYIISKNLKIIKKNKMINF